MSDVSPSILFAQKLIEAGVIPKTAISFRITAEVNAPVLISVSHYATTRECDLIVKTLDQIIKDNRNV